MNLEHGSSLLRCASPRKPSSFSWRCLPNDSASFFSYCRKWIKSSLVLVTLLGLTWILGLLKFRKTIEGEIALAYIFVILNALHGVLFFLLNIVMNEQVLESLMAVLLRRKWRPDWVEESERRQSRRREVSCGVKIEKVCAADVSASLLVLN